MHEMEELLQKKVSGSSTKKKSKGNLLIIDDNRSIVQALCEILKDDFEITCTYSCEESIEKVNQSHQIALLDVKMPGNDGIITFNLLKEKLLDLKIVFHSAYPGNYDKVLQVQEMSHFGYFTKGEYSNQELIDHLNNLL